MSLRCPCCSGEQFDDCCQRILRGEVDAATAEQLMRSRFSAFAVSDAAYLLTSWHPDTAPKVIDLDPTQRWYRLDIHRVQAGGLLDRTGGVEFSAHYRHPEGNGVLREASRFVREDGRWLYLDGTVAGSS